MSSFVIQVRVGSPEPNHLGLPFNSHYICLTFWTRLPVFVNTFTTCKAPGFEFGPHRVFDFPGTYHIWWTFASPPSGEGGGVGWFDGRSATSHQIGKWFNCRCGLLVRNSTAAVLLMFRSLKRDFYRILTYLHTNSATAFSIFLIRPFTFILYGGSVPDTFPFRRIH